MDPHNKKKEIMSSDNSDSTASNGSSNGSSSNSSMTTSYSLPRRAGTFTEKLKRMVTEQPFIPVGVGVTCYFLISGLRAMKGGDKVKSQQMMRGRVAAQGFTIAAIFFGIFYKTQYSILPPSITGFNNNTDDDQK